DRMLEMAAHATISAHGEPMANWEGAVAEAMVDDRVAGAAPYIETQALIAGPRREPALLQGISPEHEREVSKIAERMVAGSLDDLAPGGFNIVLGRDLALWLGVGVGDTVIVTTDFQTTPMGA